MHQEEDHNEEEARRKKAQEILDELTPLAENMQFYMDVELVFRSFLRQKLKDAAQEFYKEMLFHLESEGYAQLEATIIDSAFDISDKIHGAIWDNQIDRRYHRPLYQACKEEARRINPDWPRIDFDDEDEDEEEDMDEDWDDE